MTDAIGNEVAKQLLESSQVSSRKVRDATARIAQTITDKEQAKLIEAARKAPFARVALWMDYLPISYREKIVLGRIYSFQCSGAEFRQSLSTAAREMQLNDRQNLKKVLARLVDSGYITCRSNGARKPNTYAVDEVACMMTARERGYPG